MNASFASIKLSIDGQEVSVRSLDYADASLDYAGPPPALTEPTPAAVPVPDAPFEFTFTAPANGWDVFSAALAKSLDKDLADRFTEHGFPALARALERGDLRVVRYDGEDPTALEWTLAWAELVVLDYDLKVELQRLVNGATK